MINTGETLNNRYRLGQKIGDGGTAQVFQAQDVFLGRTVAVKILDTDFSDEQAAFKRFQAEGQAIAALDHPNIIAIYDFGLLLAEQSAYLVMPYVKGGPLSERIRTNRLTFEEISSYLEQLAQALDYAHLQGVIHRDVKPSNILMRPDNRLLLSDFGFAKLLDDAARGTYTQARGTVEYIAPEQIFGRVSAASDQYALGVILYQMLTGGLPFTGKMQAILTGHAEQPPPPLSSRPAMQAIPREVIARLDEVLARVLAKDPAQRYPNCAELSRAYRQAIMQFQTVAANIQPPQPVKVGAVLPHILSPQPVATQPEEADGPTVRLAPAALQPIKRILVQPARLSVVTRPDQGIKQTFELNELVMKLGRGAENNLYLPLATISRHHATLYRLDSGLGYHISDNQSRNGLLYKGNFIKEKVLEDGDVIEIGKPNLSEYVVYLTYTAPVFR